MKYIIFIMILFFPAQLLAQSATIVSTPQHIVIDSRDNLFVTRQYGLVKIAPDGAITDLSKQGSGKGMDRSWQDMVIDSKDNLYLNDGNVLFKVTVSDNNIVSMSKFAGQEYSYKLEDGPLATAGFNAIGLMTIDKNDNIYLTDSYDKIKDTIGGNFVTDKFDLTEPARKIEGKNRKAFSIIRKIRPDGTVSTLKTPQGKFILVNQVSGMTTDLEGNIIFASYSFGRFIAKIDVTTGAITLVAGQPYKREWCPVYTQGPVATAEFTEPETIIVSRKGEVVFTDQRLHRVIKVAGGRVSTLAGGNTIQSCSHNIAGRAEEGNRDGKALTALFNMPKGIAYDSKGNLFIADMNNHAIRKLSPDGTVTTFAK
jgi:hypothetical protein